MGKKFISRLSISLSITVMTFLAVLISGLTANAIIANPIPFEYRQPNSDIITVTKKGDEFLNWEEDSKGYLLVKENDTYYYAVWTDNGPAATAVAASNSITNHPGSVGSDIPESLITKSNDNANSAAMAFRSVPSVNSDPQRKLLVVYVTYNDDPVVGSNFQFKMTDQDIQNKFFYGSNSVNDFYKKMLNTTDDVIIPATGTGIITPGLIRVNLPGTHPNAQGDSNQRRQMVNAALNEAANNGLDFSEFITDGSNTLKSSMLSIALIFQGFEASYSGHTPSIWASAGYGGTYGGTYIESAFLQGSVHGDHFLPIGVIAHELGHSGYDFDDTYDYGNAFNDGTSGGHGFWSLMSSGSWGSKSGDLYQGETPAYADAYNLVTSGLVTPEVINYDEAATETISNHTEIYKIVPKNSSSQYFLLQQRLNEDYDRGAFYRISSSISPSDGGLLIYHVDESVPLYRINDKNTHYTVAIEEAHGGTPDLSLTNGNYGDFGDLFGNGKNEFSLSSDPNSLLYSAFTNDFTPPVHSINSGVNITNIQHSLANRQTTFTLDYQDVEDEINLFPQSSLADTGYGVWFREGESKPNLPTYEQNINNVLNVDEGGTYYYAYGTQWFVPDTALAIKVEVSVDLTSITATPGYLSKTWWPVEESVFIQDYVNVASVSGYYPNFTISLNEISGTQDDYGDTIQDAYTFTLNDIFDATTLNGSIEDPNDADMFRLIPIDYSTGGIYTIYSSNTSIDIMGALYDENGNLLAVDDNSRDGLNFEINYELDNRESYYIKVYNSLQTGTGSYKLNVQYDDCGNTFGTARTVSVENYPNRYFINYADDVDIFEFTAETTGIHTFFGMGEDDCAYTLYDSTGSEIATFSTIVPSMSSPYHNFKYNLTEGETYYVKVAAMNSYSSNTYQFIVYDYDYN